MDGYTRYTNPFAYSNALGVRTDYYQTTKAAREAAENGKVLSSYAFEAVDGQEKTVELRALKSTRLTNPAAAQFPVPCIPVFPPFTTMMEMA